MNKKTKYKPKWIIFNISKNNYQKFPKYLLIYVVRTPFIFFLPLNFSNINELPHKVNPYAKNKKGIQIFIPRDRPLTLKVSNNAKDTEYEDIVILPESLTILMHSQTPLEKRIAKIKKIQDDKNHHEIINEYMMKKQEYLKKKE